MNTTTDVVNIAKNIISFDTTINPREGVFPQSDCAGYIREFGKENNYEIIEIDNCKWARSPDPDIGIYPVILYKRAGDNPDPVVLFLGHIDVVPVPEGESWNTDPFTPTIIDDKLYGRGSSDMKGAVAAFLSAFADYQPDKGTVVIALCGDEEVGGNASMPVILEKLKENNLLPQFVINGEPSSKPIVVTKRRGASWIKLSFPLDKVEVKGKLESFEFNSFTGNGAKTLHSASFTLGADSHAMYTAAKQSFERMICSLSSSSVNDNSVPATVKMSYVDLVSDGDEKHTSYFNVTKFMNGVSSLASLNWPIVQSKYGISVCPNLFKLDEENNEAYFVFDIRAMYRDENGHEDTIKLLLNHFQSFVPEVKVEALGEFNPVNVDPNHPLPRKVAEVARNHGVNIVDVGEKLGGASDTRYFTNIGIPGVELGMGGANEHGPNEWTSVSQLKRFPAIYREIFEELSK